MLKLYSNLKGLKVISFQDERKIADFEDLLVLSENAQVLGVFVREKGLLRTTRKFIVLPDVLEFSNGIYVQDQSSLIDPEELVRLKDTKESYFPLEGLAVKDTEKHKLGNVEDYTFDSLTGQILKFHVSPGILSVHKKHRIIPLQRVHKLTRKALLVTDLEKQKESNIKEMLDLKTSFGNETSFSTKEAK